MSAMAAAERSGRPFLRPAWPPGKPPGGPKIIKISNLFRLTARLGDRFGGWEVGGSIELIEIYRFPPSNLDLDLIWSILRKYFYIFAKKSYWMFIS